MEEDCCKTCKSFSPSRECGHGYCLKWRGNRKLTDVCGEYKPNIKAKYEMECNAVNYFNTSIMR